MPTLHGDNGNNGRPVTARELADKLGSLRWELRFYVASMALVALWRFEGPEMAKEAVAALISKL